MKTQAWALFIQSVTGKYPQVKRHDDYNQVLMNKEQIAKMQGYFQNIISMKPGDVRVNLNSVIAPVIMRKYLGWFILAPLGILTLGGLLRAIGHRKA